MYTVTAHIVRGSFDANALAGLSKLRWRAYRDDGADAWLIDVYADEHSAKWPFTQHPAGLKVAGKANEASLLQDVLKRVGARDVPALSFAAFNFMLSKTLGVEVLSISSDDEEIDMACRSHDGRIEEIAVEYYDVDLRWRDGRVEAQLLINPLASDEEVREFGTSEEAFKGLRNVKVLPRTVELQPLLHHLAAGKTREFLGGRETFLDLSSFDCLQRVPARPTMEQSS